MPSHHHLHRHIHERRAGHSHLSDFTHVATGVDVLRRSPALPSDAFVRRQVINFKHTASTINRRDEFKPADENDHMINVMLTILTIVFCLLVVFSVLAVFRRKQRQRSLVLDEKNDVLEYQENGRYPHNLTIETTHNGHSSVVVIGRDGRPMLKNSGAPPNSPDNVPEIRITFPDEQDRNGQQQHGRVLVVRVGDNATIGLEPVQEEQLPAYEKEAKGQFISIDMDQIGGLKDEKDRVVFR